MGLIKYFKDLIDELTKETHSLEQITTPKTLYPIYLSKINLHAIPNDKLYIGKMAIVRRTSEELFGESDAKNIYSYLQEKDLPTDLSYRKELAALYCDNHEYEGRAKENVELLDALKSLYKAPVFLEYYMYTEKGEWEKLESAPTKFADSDIRIFKSKSDLFNDPVQPIQFEIVYTISDDGYWVNVSEDKDAPLYGFIGYKQDLRTLESNMVEVYYDYEDLSIPYLKSCKNVNKTKVIFICNEYRNGDEYLVYHSDNNGTYNNSNTIRVYFDEED